MMGVFGYEIGAAHAKILLDADRAALKEDERREADIEAARNRAPVLAPIQREQYELARRAVDLGAEWQERAAERERQERAEQAANYRAALIMSGQRPHSVQDVFGHRAIVGLTLLRRPGWASTLGPTLQLADPVKAG